MFARHEEHAGLRFPQVLIMLIEAPLQEEMGMVESSLGVFAGNLYKNIAYMPFQAVCVV